MPRAYYSSVLNHSADRAWGLIRDFNNYPRYIEGITKSVIEDGKRGDEVGAVRRFCYGGAWIRQRLIAHSDTERSFGYQGLEPFTFPGPDASDAPGAIDYSGTVRLSPIVDGGQTFIEWFVDFDCAPEDRAQWNEKLMSLIPEWVGSLRGTLERA
jgi:polyketide cyclase/dehydrase/lipid transport protein